jgi:type VI secretion system protein VasG
VPAIELRLLVARLNDVSRRALEASAGLALSRTHYNVEIEHWLIQLLDSPGSDVQAIARDCGIARDRVIAELSAALDRMATGNGRAPSLSPDLIAIMKDAWLLASVEQERSAIRSGHLLWAMLSDEAIASRLLGKAPELRRIVPDVLRRDFVTLLADTAEAAPAEQTTANSAPSATHAASSALGRYTVDLTARARDGRIDPILGRDTEIRQVIDVLTRRRQNNPIMTGEAGVGKTAVVEGLALRIAAGDVPPPLAHIAIRTLDLGLLQAGAGVKGEFENRLRSVIDEAQSSSEPVILFIDEAHTLIGAGGAPGQGDAANLLKPPLARGELRVIAATTWAEYKKYFEKDAALARRFQPVVVDEPSEPVAIGMVRGLMPSLEAHHKVRILDEAAQAAVRLSTRYIQGRQLPDKAVSLIDTACARVSMSLAATPPAVEDRRRRLSAIEAETRVLRREEISGADHATRLAELRSEGARLNAELEELQARWAEECALAKELVAFMQEAEAGGGGVDARVVAAAEKLRLLQGERPMVFPVVDAQAVAEIVENWTGIPAGRMQTDEIDAVLNLRQALGQRVVGQDHALEAVSQAIRTSRAGLTDPRKPVGVFLMVGTSGVGKTETALALADILYGGEQNLTVINMSEFKEEHKVSLLMGSPPGYVGYGEGGVLTEAVRRRPHSVLLLDEIEKAHPGVQEVFFQIFDKGTMKDGEGRDIDFRNTIIIMTTNAGTALIDKLFADPQTAPDAAGLAEALRGEMTNHFKPAFLGRVSVVPYLPLAPDTLRRIVTLQLDRIARRVRQRYGAVLTASESAKEIIMARANNAAAGARSVETFLAQTVLPDLSTEFLSRMAAGSPIARIELDGTGDGAIVARFDDTGSATRNPVHTDPLIMEPAVEAPA